MLQLLRGFSIQLRMRGAIFMVLGLFALTGTAAIGGGVILRNLNADVMDHSIKELTSISQVAQAMDGMRLAERDMVIGYEDNNRNHIENRRVWDAGFARTSQLVNAMLEGDEDEDNPIARDVLQQLEEYKSSAQQSFKGMEANAYDTSSAVVKAMRATLEKSAQIRENVEKIQRIVTEESASSRAAYEQTMSLLFRFFVGFWCWLLCWSYH